MMQKYRKKPVVVEAVMVAEENVEEITALEGVDVFLTGPHHPSRPQGRLEFVQIKTLEGSMAAKLGDWIIRGTRGELYPCRPEVFEDVYEPCQP